MSFQKWISVCVALGISASVHAVTGPAAMTFSATLVNDTTGVPLTGPVNLEFQVRSPNGICLLYSENHSNVPLDANGNFSLNVGQGARNGTDPSLVWQDVFSNKKVHTNSTHCSGGYTPAAGDNRVLRVIVGGTPLNPDFAMSSVPFATVADTVQGYSPADLVTVNGGSMTGSLSVGNSAQIAFFNATNSNYVSLRGPSSSSSNVVFTLPAVDGNGGDVLVTNGSGQLGWAAPASGGLSAGGGVMTGFLGLYSLTSTGQGPATSGFSIGDAGKMWFNSSTGKMMFWDGDSVELVGESSGITSLTGDVSAPGNGVTTITNDAITTAKIADGAVVTTKIADNGISTAKLFTAGGGVNRLVMTDASSGSTLVAKTCLNGEVLQYTTATGWICATVNSAVDGALLTNVNAMKLATRNVSVAAPGANQVLAWNSTASHWEPKAMPVGTVTSVIAGTGLVGGTIVSSGSMAVDVGTTALKIVQLNGSAQLPAVDGSQLTNISSSKLATRNVSATLPGHLQVLGWNNSTSIWEPMNGGGGGGSGTVTMVSTGTGLLGGPIVNAGSISVDVGTTSMKIVQLNASAQLPAVDGSLLTNINSMKLATRPVSAASPGGGQVLTWNSSSSQWEPSNSAGGGSVVSVVSGTGLVAGAISSSGTIHVDVGVSANKIVQLNGSAQLPAVDGSQLTNISSSKLATRNVSATLPGHLQVLGWNNSTSIWEPMNGGGGGGSGTVTMVSTGTGLLGGPIVNAGSISVDVGTIAFKIVQLNGSAQLPAVDGSLLTNMSTTKIRGVTVSAVGPSHGQVLTYNSSSGGVWEPGAGLSFPLMSTTNGNASAPAYSFSSGTSTGMFFAGANTLAFSTNAAERMRIASSGNVGIGTLSASQKLEVAGVIRSSGANPGLNLDGTAVNSGANWSIFPTSGTPTDSDFLRFHNASNQTVFLIGEYGQTGVAYPNNGMYPQSALDVYGNAAIGAYAGLTMAPADGLIVSGNVGIGTSSPSSKLTVQGSVELKSGQLKFPDGSMQDTACVTQHGSAIFSTSGSWTVPANVTSVKVYIIGGGGGGSSTYMGGDGASGWLHVNGLTPGANVPITVGTGGTGSSGSGVSGTPSHFGSPGTYATANYGAGASGSNGAVGSITTNSLPYVPAPGLIGMYNAGRGGMSGAGNGQGGMIIIEW